MGRKRKPKASISQPGAWSQRKEPVPEEKMTLVSRLYYMDRAVHQAIQREEHGQYLKGQRPQDFSSLS